MDQRMKLQKEVRCMVKKYGGRSTKTTSSDKLASSLAEAVANTETCSPPADVVAAAVPVEDVQK